MPSISGSEAKVSTQLPTINMRIVPYQLKQNREHSNNSRPNDQKNYQFFLIGSSIATKAYVDTSEAIKKSDKTTTASINHIGH